jgi:hypothetical protein
MRPRLPILFSLHADDMPTSSRHGNLRLYADDTALIATSRTPLHLVRYLVTYLNRLEHRLRDWRLAIGVSWCSLLRLRDASKDPGQIFGEPIQWVETARYLRVTLDTRLIRLAHKRSGELRLKDWVCLTHSLTGVAYPSRTVCCSTSSSSVLWWTTHALSFKGTMLRGLRGFMD